MEVFCHKWDHFGIWVWKLSLSSNSEHQHVKVPLFVNETHNNFVSLLSYLWMLSCVYLNGRTMFYLPMIYHDGSPHQNVWGDHWREISVDTDEFEWGNFIDFHWIMMEFRQIICHFNQMVYWSGKLYDKVYFNDQFIWTVHNSVKYWSIWWIIQLRNISYEQSNEHQDKEKSFVRKFRAFPHDFISLSSFIPRLLVYSHLKITYPNITTTYHTFHMN